MIELAVPDSSQIHTFAYAKDGGQEWIRTTEGDASGFTVRQFNSVG